MNADAVKDDAIRRFMWAVQALTLPAEEQEQLFPDFAVVPDELALDHEEAQRAFVAAGGETRLSSSQREAMRRLDRQLERMSGLQNEQFWTEAALRIAPEWARVRELAAAVLREMGWPLERPPTDRAIYIGSSIES